VDYLVYKIKHLCNRQITVHGSGFRHPGRNDGVLVKMRIPVFNPQACEPVAHKLQFVAHILNFNLTGFLYANPL